MIGHLKDMIHRIAPCDEVRMSDMGCCVELLNSFSHLVPPFLPFAKSVSCLILYTLCSPLTFKTCSSFSESPISQLRYSYGSDTI